MIHARSVALGVVCGTLASLTIVGACKKSGGDEAAAKASEGKGPVMPPQSPEELSAPIATIDGSVITVAEFQERINRQSPYIRARYTSLEQKKEFLDNLIRFEVLAQEGLRRGLDKDPDVVRTMKQVMIQKLMKDEFETKLKPEDVSEADMKKFFEEHQNEYNKPEEVRVSAIIVKDKATADKAAKDAAGEQGKSNKGFRELVTKYSTDEPTKLRGGDLRYFADTTQEVPAPVVKAAFALAKTGDVSGAIDAGNGAFYVLKQTGRRKALVKSFEEVKRQIQNRLYRDKRTQAQKDFITGLKDKAKITVDEAALGKVRVDTSGAGPGDEPIGHGSHAGPGGPGIPVFPGEPPGPADPHAVEQVDDSP
jgi:peptidyl-prolyl cis-trans isomerase C